MALWLDALAQRGRMYIITPLSALLAVTSRDATAAPRALESDTAGLIPSASGGGHDASHSDNPLKRTLGTFDLLAVGVGGIIGAGIYVLTGQAAALYAGPAVVLSFVVSAVACCFSALSYSELAAMMPVAGSAYSFTSATLGPAVGFWIGHDLMLEYLFGAATVAVGWSGYAVSLLRDMGAVLPTGMTSAPFKYDPKTDSMSYTNGGINVPAIAIVLAMTALNVVGMRESATFNLIVVVIKVVVLIVFVCAGALYVQPDNWQPFVPPATDTPGIYGWTGIFRGSASIFFAYIGFDAISCSAQEAVNPQVSVPIATIASVFICTGLYIAVALVLTGLVPYAQLDVPDPIAVAVDAAGPGLMWLRPVVKVGALLGLTSVVMVLIMGQARIFYAMADDGMLPAVFARVHPRFKTPWVTTIVTGLVASVVAGFLPIDILGEMVSIGTLFAFVLVNVGVLVLRWRSPELHRPFRTPWVPFVPIMGVLTAVIQMVALPGGTWLRLAVWLVVGALIYFFYSRKHAKPFELRRAALLGLRRPHGSGGLAGRDDDGQTGGLAFGVEALSGDALVLDAPDDALDAASAARMPASVAAGKAALLSTAHSEAADWSTLTPAAAAPTSGVGRVSGRPSSDKVAPLSPAMATTYGTGTLQPAVQPGSGSSPSPFVIA